jgi:urease accessory protein
MSSLAAFSTLLTLSDSRLPTGGHVHSGGVEEAVTSGLVVDLPTLRAFLRRRIRTQAWSPHRWPPPCTPARSPLPPPTAKPMPAHRLRGARRIRAQGRGLTRLARRVWPDRDWAAIGVKPHLAVAAGEVGLASGLAPEQTALSLVYTTMTGSATAAQRLLALDPGDVAAVTFELSPLCDQTAALAAKELADLPIRSSTCWLNGTPNATVRSLSLEVRLLERCTMPPHLLDGEPYAHRTSAPGPPRRRAAAHRHRRPGRLRQDGLVAALCRQLRDELSLAVLTNDIYTTEDADFLRKARRASRRADRRRADGRLPAHRHPRRHHRQPRRIDDLVAGNEALDLILVESGGDNLTATFSSGLVDVQIFVVDVAGGDKVPRKGGPGVTYSDLLVINKTDLAPLVGADLDVMRRDAARVRNDRPFVLISLTDDPTAAPVLGWVHEQLRVPV